MIPYQDKAFTIIRACALIVLSFSALAYTYQYGRSINQSYYRSFSVTGEGTVVTTPDVASFSASVITDGGMSVSEVQQQNVEKTNKVIEFVKAQGVDGKDIKTQQYVLNPRYEYPVCIAGKTCSGPKIVGYNVTQSIAIKVRDMEKIGTLLSGVVENGANSVSDIAFVVDSDSKAKNEARNEAISQGRKQALAIAREAGFSVGKLVSVYEEGGDAGIPPVAYGGADMTAASNSAKEVAAPSIEPGSNEQKVRMVLTYEIR